MKSTVKCPECYSTELYKNSKDKRANQKYYLGICIDSETRFITSCNLNKSREAVKNTFDRSTHIVVKDFDDDISNNLIESLSGLTAAQVCSINYTHQEKVNWFIKY